MLSITAPLRSVFPLTVIPEPSRPAQMPAWSVTLWQGLSIPLWLIPLSRWYVHLRYQYQILRPSLYNASFMETDPGAITYDDMVYHFHL